MSGSVWDAFGGHETAVKNGLLGPGGCIVGGDEHTTWWCATCQQSFNRSYTYRAINEAIDAAAASND